MLNKLSMMLTGLKASFLELLRVQLILKLPKVVGVIRVLLKLKSLRMMIQLGVSLMIVTRQNDLYLGNSEEERALGLDYDVASTIGIAKERK